MVPWCAVRSEVSDSVAHGQIAGQTDEFQEVNCRTIAQGPSKFIRGSLRARLCRRFRIDSKSRGVGRLPGCASSGAAGSSSRPLRTDASPAQTRAACGAGDEGSAARCAASSAQEFSQPDGPESSLSFVCVELDARWTSCDTARRLHLQTSPRPTRACIIVDSAS